MGRMANTAIANATETLRGLLAAAGTVHIVQTAGLQAPLPEGISVYLYRIAPDTSIRTSPRVSPTLRLNLYYLLIAWSPDPLGQQDLLARAARALFDHPVQPGNVQFLADSLTLADELQIWQAAPANRQPAIPCLARGVVVEPL